MAFGMGFKSSFQCGGESVRDAWGGDKTGGPLPPPLETPRVPRLKGPDCGVGVQIFLPFFLELWRTPEKTPMGARLPQASSERILPSKGAGLCGILYAYNPHFKTCQLRSGRFPPGRKVGVADWIVRRLLFRANIGHGDVRDGRARAQKRNFQFSAFRLYSRGMKKGKNPGERVCGRGTFLLGTRGGVDNGGTLAFFFNTTGALFPRDFGQLTRAIFSDIFSVQIFLFLRHLGGGQHGTNFLFIKL